MERKITPAAASVSGRDLPRRLTVLRRRRGRADQFIFSRKREIRTKGVTMPATYERPERPAQKNEGLKKLNVRIPASTGVQQDE